MEKCSKISHLSKSDNHTQEIGDCVIRQFPLSSWRQQLTGATVKLHSRSTLRDQKRSRRQHSNSVANYVAKDQTMFDVRCPFVRSQK